MNQERADELTSEIWSLLEKGLTEKAVSRSLEALNEDDDQPEFHYLLGISLLDLGEVDAATPEFEKATALDDEWPDPQAGLAWAYFRACRFADSAKAADRALLLDPEIAETHQLRGILAERRGEEAESLLAFAEARRLDPERFPDPYEMSEEEFLQVAQETVDELDEKIKSVLQDAALFVQQFPHDDLLRESDPPLDPQLLGLFVGRSLLEQSHLDSGTLPNTMYFFQKNIERIVTSREELEDEIRITVLHEIGHHLGWDEDELAARGLA